MPFEDITISDRQDVEDACRKAGITYCDFAFANLLCWSESCPAQISRTDGAVVIRAVMDKSIGPVYTIPVGEGDPSALYRMMEEDAASQGTSLKIWAPTAEAVSDLRVRYPDYGFFYLRRSSDYIYRRDDLAALAGHRYQAKRNHVNKFESEYDFEYSALTGADKNECLDLLHRWREQRICESDVNDFFITKLDNEESGIRKALAYFDALGLIGGAIRVGGKMVAFCYGSAVSDDTFCTHIEKADEHFDGVFPTINRLFAEHLPERFKYINREDDLGLPGLRNAKQTYHPVRMLDKYIAAPMTPAMLEVKRLWLECFDQDGPLDAEQFLLTQFNEDMMLSRCENDRIVSMLHIIPFGDTAYLYAICTAPEYRHRGIAGGLVREALEKCRTIGFKRAALIPEGEQAVKWYASMGFEGPVPESFATMDYDFGKCDGTPDMAMIFDYR